MYHNRGETQNYCLEAGEDAIKFPSEAEAHRKKFLMDGVYFLGNSSQ